MQNLKNEILKFRDDRGWNHAHREKDLAISIVLEASELLENFQWKSSEEAATDTRQNIKEEMADVLIYLVQLADSLDVDLEDEVYKKLEKNNIKYPVKQGS
jgi:NTP pyrophosphatase (non-canonical NTP hydrolase)